MDPVTLALAKSYVDRETSKRYAIQDASRLVVWDSFTRDDTSAGTLGTADSGQVWDAASSSWSIGGNKAVALSTSPLVPARLPAALGNGRAILHQKEEAGDPGIIFRYIDNDNYLGVFASSARMRVYKVVTGVQTILGSTANPYVLAPLEVFWYNDRLLARMAAATMPVTLTADEYTLFPNTLGTIGLGRRASGLPAVSGFAAWSVA